MTEPCGALPRKCLLFLGSTYKTMLFIGTPRLMYGRSIHEERMMYVRVSRLMIIHLLGLAPAGYLTASDNGA
jgi:hypothetical protein